MPSGAPFTNCTGGLLCCPVDRNCGISHSQAILLLVVRFGLSLLMAEMSASGGKFGRSTRVLSIHFALEINYVRMQCTVETVCELESRNSLLWAIFVDGLLHVLDHLRVSGSLDS
jgi:hypothetical protein